MASPGVEHDRAIASVRSGFAPFFGDPMAGLRLSKFDCFQLVVCDPADGRPTLWDLVYAY